jgi:CRP/FNR family transcriptional regulator, cyclic AMP receptor protein
MPTSISRERRSNRPCSRSTTLVHPDILERIPALAGLPSEAKQAIAQVAREVRYPKGRPIYPLLKPPQDLVMILEGLARMSGVAVAGIERIIYVYRPGEIMGSRVLLETSPEASYEVTAMRPVRALAVSKLDFLAVGRRYPDILVAVTGEFSRRLDHMTHRVLSAMSVEVPVRLSQLLLDFAADGAGDDGGFVPLAHSLTHETMAQIIGASRPHTSTVLRDLEGAGAVQRRSRRGLLVRPERLRQIVESESVASPGD